MGIREEAKDGEKGRGCGPCPLRDYWWCRIGEGTPGLAAVNPSLGVGARRRSALQCHCQSQCKVTLTKGGTMTASSLSFAANDGDYEVEMYNNIKKRRGPRGRWWRWIAAFSLLLLVLLGAITVMCVVVVGNANGNRRGGIDAASGQIKSASSEGGAGGSKGGSNGDNDDAHSDDAVGGSNRGLHVAVDPPWAETSNGGGGRDDNDDNRGRHRKTLTTMARGSMANASEGRHGKMTMVRGDTRRRVESTKGCMMTARGFTARGGDGKGRHRVDS
jgi:hypothetical protein